MNESVRLCWFTVTFKHAAEKEKNNKLLQVLGNLPPETGGKFPNTRKSFYCGFYYITREVRKVCIDVVAGKGRFYIR